MPLDPDYVRAERIKKLRALVKSGEGCLLALHEAVPRYLRRGKASEERIDAMYEKVGRATPRIDVSPEFERDSDIRTGVLIEINRVGLFRKIDKWVTEVYVAAEGYFTEDLYAQYLALEDLPTITVDYEGVPNMEARLDELSSAIEERVKLIGEQLKIDGEHEDVTPALRDAAGGWPHLRGVIDDTVLDGYLAQMRKRRTNADISSSIGAAKEVTEATMKALAAKHGVSPGRSTPDLQDWWKSLKPVMADASIDRALGHNEGALVKLLGGHINTVQSLGELRNKVGSGHGKSSHPAGLKPAHALLAVDTAHTLTRYLVN